MSNTANGNQEQRINVITWEAKVFHNREQLRETEDHLKELNVREEHTKGSRANHREVTKKLQQEFTDTNRRLREQFMKTNKELQRLLQWTATD